MVYLYGHAQGAIKVFDSTPAMNIQDSRRLVTKQDAVEKAWVNDYLPEYALSPFDKGPYLRDETALQFALWRMVGEEDQTMEYIEPVQSQIYIIPSGGRDVFYNAGGLRMAEAGGIINFRDTGLCVSKAYDLERHAVDFMRSDEGYEFAIEHHGQLSNSPNIDWTVVGKIPGSPNAVYGVAQVSEDSALLFGNVDSYKMIDGWAGREGIDTNDFILRAMGEEFAHLIRRGTAGVPEEETVRVWLIDMYNALAEKSFDPEIKGKYQRMVSALERDLATVAQRYSKSYSKNLGNLVKVYMSDSSKLEMVLEAEARMEYGLTGEREVSEYVAGRLEQIAEAAERGDARTGKEYGENRGHRGSRRYAESKDVDGEAEECAVCAAESDGAEGGDEGGPGGDGEDESGGDSGGPSGE